MTHLEWLVLSAPSLPPHSHSTAAFRLSYCSLIYLGLVQELGERWGEREGGREGGLSVLYQ